VNCGTEKEMLVTLIIEPYLYRVQDFAPAVCDSFHLPSLPRASIPHA